MRVFGCAVSVFVFAALLPLGDPLREMGSVAQGADKAEKPISARGSLTGVVTEKTMLWNGKDFTGWKLFVPDSNHDVTNPLGDALRQTWSVVEGVVRCEGEPHGYLRTEKDYADYLLHVEWRWVGNGGNSGVFVHVAGQDMVWPKGVECQLMAGNAGDFWLVGSVETKEHAKGGERVSGRRITKLNKSSEKPPGEWNSYDIVCKDDWIVVVVNGVLQNVATGCSVRSGKIVLQSEGAPIDFRNIYLEPLE